jgi:hypothetical protein
MEKIDPEKKRLEFSNELTGRLISRGILVFAPY